MRVLRAGVPVNAPRPNHSPLPVDRLDVCPECHGIVFITHNHVALDLREVQPGTPGAMAVLQLAHLVMASSPMPGAALFAMHDHQPPENVDQRPTETIADAWRRSRRGTKARQGFDLLLATYPQAEVWSVEPNGGPWMNVTLAPVSGENVYVDFSIWRVTGNVYKTQGGMVADDPCLVVTDLGGRPPAEEVERG